MASDFGDAPDTGLGVGIANYETLFANGGASHVIDTTQSTLFLGSRVDAEADGAANAKANGDDLYVTPNADDEDGVIDPDVDLLLTAGAVPQARLRATNTTGNSAMLYGWIDVNRNGVFDNTTERASIAVPTATVNGIFTLNFPTVPLNATGGKTYARFRLSTDTAAANPNGAASDGEVEDYQASVVRISSGEFDPVKSTRIADSLFGGPVLQNTDGFGSATANLGDFDGTGRTFVAVGAPGRDTGGTDSGAVYLMPILANGSAGSSILLTSGVGGVPTYAAGDRFGASVVSIGDINGDGVPDLAVGAPGDDTGGTNRGAVYLLRMNANGTVSSFSKIASGTLNLPTVTDGNAFGTSVTSIPDLDGDGVTELAVGSALSDMGGTDRGSISLLFMNVDGTIKNSLIIASGISGGPTLVDGDFFGTSIASIGDLNGDGYSDLVVGAAGEDAGGSAVANYGAFYVLFLNSNGSVGSFTKITQDLNGGPNNIGLFSNFGSSVSAAGDLDGDGNVDVMVGSPNYSFGGAFYSMLLNVDGTVKAFRVLSDWDNSFPTALREMFGSAISQLGDLDGDAIPDFVVGSPGDDTNGNDRGAIRIINLRTDNVAPLPSIRRFNPSSSITNADSLIFRVSFNEDVSNVDASDFSVTGSTATVQSFLSVGNNTYEIGIGGGNLASLNGSVGLSVVTGRNIVDRLGNLVANGTPASSHFYLVDNVAPLAASFTRLLPNVSPTSADSIRFRIVFNETVTNVDASDFVVAGTTASLTIVGSSTVYEATLSGGDLSNLNGSVGIDFSPSQNIIDSAMNLLVTLEPAIDETFSIVQSTLDFGDAPDTGVGTGAENYRTSLADDGPRHTIVPGLRLGASIDEEPDGLTLDDGPNILPAVDDEDSLFHPLEMTNTIGASPKIRVHATNTTGSVATLFGWIDMNRNGVFDNLVERASITVPTGSVNQPVILQFPSVLPAAVTGVTYARFRLSTDPAAANSIGLASDGEVEDYPVRLMRASDATADGGKLRELESGVNGGPSLSLSDNYGASVAALGDLNGDGVVDMAVGARRRDGTFTNDQGAVYFHRMANNGTSSSVSSPSFTLSTGDQFGAALASLGDFDGNGVGDLVIGAPGDNSGGTDRGSVYVSLLTSSGTIASSVEIASGSNGGPVLANSDAFGTSITSIGDFDGDGVTDIVVGAPGDDTDGPGRGAVYLLLLNANRTVKSSIKIRGGTLVGDGDRFGASVASLGDIDGNGVTDIVVGAPGDNGEVFPGIPGNDRGAIYFLLMNSDGTVSSRGKLGAPAPVDLDEFGYSLAAVGDLNGDGLQDLAVGAPGDDTGVSNSGAVYNLLIVNRGVIGVTKIARGIGGGPTNLASGDRFGTSIAAIGDIDGDGVVDLAVGAEGNNTSTSADTGAVHTVFLRRDSITPTPTSFAAVFSGNGTTTHTNADVLTYRVSFSEAVFNVSADDFIVTGTTATVTSVASISSSTFNLQISGGDLANLNGIVGLDLSPSANIVDRSNNLIDFVEPSVDQTIRVDNIAPILQSIVRLVPTTATTSADVLRFRATFQENVLQVDSSSFVAVGTTASIVVSPISATVYDITVSGGNLPFAVGNIGIDLAATSTIRDYAGNPLIPNEPLVDEVYNLAFYGTDFADAPDSSIGTGVGNYRTNVNDDGPRHTMVQGIMLGSSIDDEPDGQVSDDAVETSLVNNDEDGLLSLNAFQGQAPWVPLRATNLGAAPATLYGWIDINRDGVFDNTMERASVSVPAGSNNQVFYLTFGRIPYNAPIGNTFARFRLSTDTAAAESFGAASDGEVEDYATTIRPAENTIVDRRVFYNRSTNAVFGDGSGNPTNAIDSTKSALRPGETASTVNYTNYSRGLNGIVVDIASPTNLSAITAASFQFATWSSFPDSTPNFVTINPTVTVSTFAGGGLNGSDRVKLEFANNAIQNAWLRVTMLADANTGLAANDVFYFGNARFDVTPTSPFPSQQVTINAFDVNTIRARQGQNPGVISNIFDVDRNGVVNAFDTNAVRAGQGVSSLRSFTAPSTLQMGLASSTSNSTSLKVDSLFVDTSWLDAFQIGNNKNRQPQRR